MHQNKQIATNKLHRMRCVRASQHECVRMKFELILLRIVAAYFIKKYLSSGLVRV